MNTLRLGSRGAEVAQARSWLETLGYSVPGDPQVFGPVMEAAVRAFQKDYGLTVDGVIGPNTWNALGAFMNKQTSAGNSSNTAPTMYFDPMDITAQSVEGPLANSANSPFNPRTAVVPLLLAAAVAYAVFYYGKKDQKAQARMAEGPRPRRRARARKPKMLPSPEEDEDEEFEEEIDEDEFDDSEE